MKLLISGLCILLSLQVLGAPPLATISNNNEAAEQLQEILTAKQKKSGLWDKVKSYYQDSVKTIKDLFADSAVNESSDLKGRVVSQLSEKEQKEQQNVDLEVKALTAQARLVEALSSDSFSLESFMNLGLSFEFLSENEKAIKAYTQALNGSKNKNPKIEFYAYYNLGRVFGKTKNIDKALEMYQAALKFAPESKEIKTNIELLIQKNKGKGKGKGKSKDNKQDKSDKDKQKKDGEPKDKPKQPQKPKKKEFKSKNLKKKDMQKIMEEIRKQEQRIRAREFGKQRKEPPRDKDW